MLSHSLPLGPPSPTPKRAMRRAGLSPIREEGKKEFQGEGKLGLGNHDAKERAS